MKKLILTINLLLFIYTIWSYEKIVSWDNTDIKSNDLSFDGKIFYLENKKINLDDVSYIHLNLSDNDESIQKGNLQEVSVKDLLQRATILEKKYPDARVLVLCDDGIEKLNADSTRYTHSRYAIKIMNEKELGSAILTFYYEKQKYESKIIMARSISPDGEVTYLKEKDISYTTPTQGLQFFSGRKSEQIIKATIPNVKVGSIIDYEWENVQTTTEDKNQYYVGWYFGGGDPVYESSVRFIIPEDKELYWVCKNFGEANDKPVIEKKDGYKIYSFKRGECPPFVGEPYSPPMHDLIPFVSGSLFKDQTYLSDWLSKFMKERMVANDKMKQTVIDVLNKANAKTEIEKVSAIYRFVQEYIHYRSIKTSLSSGFSGHPASETFENRYGDCIDKSILFATLLNSAGVEAYPVIINTNDQPRALYNEIGVVVGNHAINEIHLKENEKKIIYLDSTSLTYRYPSFREDDQGIQAWNPILNTVREIKPVDSQLNTLVYNKEITLANNGDGDINSNTIYSGDWEAGVREYILSLKPEELKAVLSSMVARDYPGSKLNDFSFREPNDYNDNFNLKLSYKAINIAKRTGNFYVMNIPVGYSFDYTGLKDRKYPVLFPTTEGKKNLLTINLPKDFKFKGLPEAISINNKYFKYTGKYTKVDNKIIFEDHFERTGCNVTASDYENFRKDILKIDYFVRIPLVFFVE